MTQVKALTPIKGGDTRSFYLREHYQGRKTWSEHRSLPCRTTGVDRVSWVNVHSAENTPDFRPPDHGAEHVAAYGASLTRPTAKRSASWSCTVDADSVLWMLEDEARSWQVHNFSHSTIGFEIATKAHLWDSLPGWYVSGLLENAARVTAFYLRRFDLPPVYRTRGEVCAGKPGITMHGWLDPDRRTDPGVDVDRLNGRVCRDKHGQPLNPRFTSFPADEFLHRVEKQYQWQNRNGLVVPTAWITGRKPDIPPERCRTCGQTLEAA